jgi:hypothetical protein
MPTTSRQHHLSVSGSKNGPPPIDNAACVALIAGALKGAREKTRELLSRNGASPADNGGSNGMQKPGVTLDLSHQKIANIPIEVIELIKDEIERSVGDRHRCIPVPSSRSEAVLTRSGACCCLYRATPELPISVISCFPREQYI